jgi:hypothetical protein
MVLLLAGALSTSDPFLRSADLLISALLALAILEHWFLVLPFGESALWRWAQDQDGAAQETPARPNMTALRAREGH